ncbi:MAG: hypothetical protein R3325_08690 [Thermoanaerobaculia bacterium]|nr:hypothetical protein [Thermoanaerobaculia bacterium]
MGPRRRGDVDPGAAEALPDRLLDEVLPERLEWKRLVRRYPKSCLLIALAGGYVLGRRRGWEILEALAGFAADTATESINHAVGRDLL